MKITAIGLGLLLAGVLFCLACSGGQNLNGGNTGSSANSGNSNSNGNSQSSLQTAKGTPTPDPCASALGQRAADVATYLRTEVQGVPKLASQYPGKFDFRVVNPPQTQYLIVYVGGLVQANHGPNNNLLKKFEDILDPVMHDGCVMRVDMVATNQLPPPTITSVPPSTTVGPPPIGFEVTSCDDPAHPCPNGTCSESCPTIVPTPSPAAGNANSKPAPRKSP